MTDINHNGNKLIYFYDKHIAQYPNFTIFAVLSTNKKLKPFTKMKELLERIEAAVAAFNKDANAQVENGNKAAGTRARKASLEIEKAMKEFRKASLEQSKN